MYCANCGAKLKEKANFCPKCGRSATEKQEQPAETEPVTSEDAAKVVQCKNGHFFDKNRLSACPLCGCGEGKIEKEDESVESANRKKKDVGWILGFAKKNRTSLNNDQKTISLKMKKKSQHQENKDSVLPRGDTGNAVSDAETGKAERSTGIPRPERDEERDAGSNTPTQKLREQLNRSVVWEDENKTVGRYHTAELPVVGWLICLEGVCQGEAFPLKKEQNNVGRGANMDVVLERERSVSRERHIVIIYEPRKRVFYLQQGENLSYLNDEPVLTTKELKIYDKLRMGESVYMFYPLCGEEFTWDDYIKVED